MNTNLISLYIGYGVGNSSMTTPSLAACSIGFLTLTFVSLSFVTNASAQQGMSVSSQTAVAEAAPPPLKLLSKDEKTALEAEPQAKGRTSLTLNLMETRLKAAEQFHSSEEYVSMYKELGGFQALLDNQLEFLIRNSGTSNKAVSSLKKFEISLHAFAPRIELLRREVPSTYEPYLKSLLKYLSEAREKALEPLFGDAGQPG
jgi:hypothetical protein